MTKYYDQTTRKTFPLQSARNILAQVHPVKHDTFVHIVDFH
jgi:hypothetical protein